MASGALHSTRYILESVWGTTPSSPAFSTGRFTSNTLNTTKDGLKSAEMRSDRQVQDLSHGAWQTGGDLGFDMSYGSFDALFEACLGGTWAVKATKTATTISAVASDNSYNDSGNGFVTAGFSVGDKVNVTGFTGNVANNITGGTITSVAAGKIIIGGTDGDVIVDDAAGESVTIATADYKLVGGTTRRSFTFERYYSDIASGGKPYHRFPGIEFTGLSMEMNANAIVTGTLSTMGKNMVLDTAAIASSTYAAASTTSVMNAFSGTVKEGGTVSGVITSINFSVDNGHERRLVIGSRYSLQPNIGEFNVEGEVSLWFEDSAMLEKFLIDDTESSLDCSMLDGAGNMFRVIFPRVKYTGGQADVSGFGPITVPMKFQALRDTVFGSALVFVRRAA